MSKIYKHIFHTLVAVVSMLLITACARGGMWGDLHCEEPEMIRIVAEIAPYQSRLPESLRATDGKKGQVTEGEGSAFQQNVREELEIERRVDFAMLYIYKGEERVKAIFYHDAQLTEGMPEPFDGLEVKSFGIEGKSLTFDTELLPGDYNFLLLVNDQPSIEAARKGQLRDPKEVATASALTAKMLGGERKKVAGVWQEPYLMPMVGQQYLSVRRLKEGESEPMVVMPAINLERVYARVAFTLTSAKDNTCTMYVNDLVENAQVDPRPYAVSPTIANRKTLGAFLDLVDVKGRQECYVALPLRDEWTASIGSELPNNWRHYGNPAPWMESIATYKATLTETIRWDLDPENSFWEGTLSGTYNIKKIFQQMATYKDGDSTPAYYLYIPPMFIKDAGEEDMPYIHLALSFLAHPGANGKDVYHYRIPLYTLEKGKKDGDPNVKRFTIRRNTNYVIHARLRGDGLEITLEDGVKVLPWKVVKQDIPINPDDPGNADPLPDWPQS